MWAEQAQNSWILCFFFLEEKREYSCDSVDSVHFLSSHSRSSSSKSCTKSETIWYRYASPESSWFWINQQELIDSLTNDLISCQIFFCRISRCEDDYLTIIELCEKRNKKWSEIKWDFFWRRKIERVSIHLIDIRAFWLMFKHHHYFNQWKNYEE